MIFETKRLKVRQLTTADFPAFFEMQGNPNIHKYTGSPVDDETSARASLKKCMAAYSKPNNDFWVWCIENKATGEMVGTCAIVDKENDIGYRFLEKHWGNGYASEICNPLIEYGLNKMNLPFVTAQADVLNVASVKVLDRSILNFEKEYFNKEENCTDRVYRLEK